MEYLNILLSIILLFLTGYIAFLVITRNRKVKIKGNDDFFTIALMIFFVIVIFPIQLDNTLIESFRNVLILVVLFASFSVKRGLGENGVYKVFHVIPWNEVTQIAAERHTHNKVLIRFTTSKITWKLIFHQIVAKEAVDYCALNVDSVTIQKNLFGEKH